MNPLEVSDGSTAISVSGLTVNYQTVKALDRVSFTVSTGSICGLVGRNGAGKSTCIRALAGLEPIVHGDVTIASYDLRNIGQIRQNVGYLLSDAALFAYLTAEETLSFVGEATGLDPAEAKRRAAVAIRFFELDEVQGRFADEFSTGTLKRLAIAAALIHGPCLLVLDEPFESLDPLIVRRLKAALARFSSFGGSVLLSTHLLDAVEEICDQVVILDHGRVLYDGEVRKPTTSFSPTKGIALEELYAELVDSTLPTELDWLVARH